MGHAALPRHLRACAVCRRHHLDLSEQQRQDWDEEVAATRAAMDGQQSSEDAELEQLLDMLERCVFATCCYRDASL